MKSEIVLALFVWLLIEVATQATTVIMLRDGRRVVVAADSAMTRTSTMKGTRDRTCKVFAGSGMLFAFAGVARFGDLIDVQKIARDAVSGASSARDVVERFMNGFPANFPLEVIVAAHKRKGDGYYRGLLDKVSESPGFETGSLYQLLVVEAGASPVVTYGDLRFAVRAGSSLMSDVKILAPRLHRCPPSCPADGLPIAMGQVGAVEREMRRYSDVAKLVDNARALLTAQAKDTPELVGPPFTVVEITRTIKWLERGACK